EGAGAHAVGERAAAIAGLVGIRHGLKKTHPPLLPLCLAVSYSTMLAATPAFSDSTLGECGMATISSIRAITSRDNPAPSFPIKLAIGPVKSAWNSGTPL